MIGNEALQIAIYERLDGAGLKVYPYTPSNAKFPFVALGEEYITGASTKSKQHFEIVHSIHAFSNSKSKAEINDLNNKIISVLSELPFPLGNGFYVSRVNLELLETLIDPEVDNVFHGITRFIFIVSKERV